MKDETKTWLKYSEENLLSAKVLFENGLFNPCLQNVQQCVEKGLKTLSIEFSITLLKTHSINELKRLLDGAGIHLDLHEDECDFLDSIYLPSKYPLGSALPDFFPDHEVCGDAISLAERIFTEVNQKLSVK